MMDASAEVELQRNLDHYTQRMNADVAAGNMDMADTAGMVCRALYRAMNRQKAIQVIVRSVHIANRQVYEELPVVLSILGVTWSEVADAAKALGCPIPEQPKDHQL